MMKKQLLIILGLMSVLGLLQADDVDSLNRKLDNQRRSLQKIAFRRIEKALGLTSPDKDAIRLEFQDLPDNLKGDRHINGSKLVPQEDGSFVVVIHREFARAGLLDLEGETTYQTARAVWRQCYPERAKVAAWFLHGMAMYASGLGDDRILAIIADNERRTTEISDGWEGETTHNDRDQADDLLLFRFVRDEGGKDAIVDWLKAVGEGTEPHRVIGDPFPGGFKNLEKKYMQQAKQAIEDMSQTGLEEFRELYDRYQEAKSKERAGMTTAFLGLIGKHRNVFWEGKARYYLGCCWLEADREEKAMNEFKKVLGDLARRSDPRFIDMAKYKMGVLLLERNRRDRAKLTFHEYIRDFTWGKYQAEARISLAEVFLDRREYKKARPYLEWVVENEPKSSAGKKAAKYLKDMK